MIRLEAGTQCVWNIWRKYIWICALDQLWNVDVSCDLLVGNTQTSHFTSISWLVNLTLTGYQQPWYWPTVSILTSVREGLKCHPTKLHFINIKRSVVRSLKIYTWVGSRNCGCLVTWFCYQLIAKPGNKTAAVSWPDPYIYFQWPCIISRNVYVVVFLIQAEISRVEL